MAACGAQIGLRSPNYVDTVQIENEAKDDIQVVVTFTDEKEEAEKAEVKGGSTWISTIRIKKKDSAEFVVPVKTVTAGLAESLSTVEVGKYAEENKIGVQKVMKMKASVIDSEAGQTVVLAIVL